MQKYENLDIYDENRWQDELRGRVIQAADLDRYIRLSDEEKRNIISVTKQFKMAITPYYLSLMDQDDPDCPIRKQVVPSIEELNFKEEELDDPLGENKHSPVARLVHRYPDRVLIFPTYECAAYCRHCFRRNVVGGKEYMTNNEMKNVLYYLETHNEIKEVILTGGDPLIISNDRLEELLLNIRRVTHVRILRIHSRLFVTLPFRITNSLVKILKSVQPIYMMAHVNHSKEITVEFKRAVTKISEAGIPIFSQTVLLKGINDDVQVLKDLFYGLVEAGVKPYYLHRCDLARGIAHFRTNIQKGIDLIRQLRGFISGLCIPCYMVEMPDGHGKVPLVYNYIRRYGEEMTHYESYDGNVYSPLG